MENEMISLIESAKKGDAAAFGQLYSIYWRELYHLALFYLKNREEAEDVVHDTVMDAFKSIGSLKSAESFKFWLFKILTRKCKIRIKNLIADRNLSDISDFLQLSSDFIPGHIEDSIALLEAVYRLKKDEQLIILLNICCGCKSSQIAKILGKTPSGVRSRLSRSLVKLRKDLEETSAIALPQNI